jgi:hypothetical protein
VPAACPLAAVFVVLASGVSAWLIASRLTLPPGRAVRLLAALVLWEAIEILPVHVLASLQLSGLISRVSISEAAFLQLIIIVVAGIWAARKRCPAKEPTIPDSKERVPKYVVVAATVLACSYLALAANVFTSFPSGPDALIYHVPLATRWLQEGSLGIPPSGAWRFSMPGNAEIGMMILLSSGWQSATVIASWIPAAIVALSTYLLAMWISGAQRVTSITCTLLILSIPMIQAQTFSAYVDLLGTAGILAAVALILSSGHGGPQLRPAIWFLSGLACGISVGTKPVYYLYAAFACLFAVSVLWVRRSDGAHLRFRNAALLVIGLLLPSIFWFARAAKQTGNPVYPIQVKVAGRTVFAGYERSEITHPDFELSAVRSPAQWPLYPWTEWKKSTGYLEVPYGEGDGLGAAFAAFVPLGLLYFVVRSFADRQSRSRNVALLASLMVLVLSWWVFMERVLRFGQLICIFACILSVPLLLFLQSRQRRAFATLFCVAISVTSLIMASVPLHMLLGRARRHLWARSSFYNYPKLIDELPAGSVIVNATGENTRNFELTGRSLSNKVITNFEAPPTAEALRSGGAVYVAEILPQGIYSEASLLAVGAVLIDDELVPTGQDKVRWRVWRLK